MLNRNNLPKGSQKMLNEILAKDPQDVTDADRAFLQARRQYLTAEEKNTFGISEPEAASDSAPEDTVQKPAKKSRKASEPEAA